MRVLNKGQFAADGTVKRWPIILFWREEKSETARSGEEGRCVEGVRGPVRFSVEGKENKVLPLKL